MAHFKCQWGGGIWDYQLPSSWQLRFSWSLLGCKELTVTQSTIHDLLLNDHMKEENFVLYLVACKCLNINSTNLEKREKYHYVVFQLTSINSSWWTCEQSEFLTPCESTKRLQNMASYSASPCPDCRWSLAASATRLCPGISFLASGLLLNDDYEDGISGRRFTYLLFNSNWHIITTYLWGTMLNSCYTLYANQIRAIGLFINLSVYHFFVVVMFKIVFSSCFEVYIVLLSSMTLRIRHSNCLFFIIFYQWPLANDLSFCWKPKCIRKMPSEPHHFSMESQQLRIFCVDSTHIYLKGEVVLWKKAQF